MNNTNAKLNSQCSKAI